MKMRKTGASRTWLRVGLAVGAALLALCSLLACSSSSIDGSGAAGRGGRAAGGSAGAAGVAGAGGTTAGSYGTAGAGGSSSGGTSGAGMGGSSAGRGGTGGFDGRAGSGTVGPDGSAGSTAGVGGTAGSAAGSGGSAGSAAGSAGSSGDSGGSAYNPCPTDGPCKILPLGDSITEGLASSHRGGYRVDLFQRALNANRRITFVGSKQSGPTMVGGTTFPRNHEGYSGETIDQIAARIPAALSRSPDIILLMIGTNDMYRMGAADAPRRLEALIGKILDANSHALLVVARIIPFPGNANVEPYNAAIPAIVQRKAAAGEHIVLVDQFSGFPNSELADGVHPNDAGYRRMAGVWYSAITPLLR
jgi:lysophospholipase L1-like esterase